MTILPQYGCFNAADTIQYNWRNQIPSINVKCLQLLVIKYRKACVKNKNTTVTPANIAYGCYLHAAISPEHAGTSVFKMRERRP